MFRCASMHLCLQGDSAHVIGNGGTCHPEYGSFCVCNSFWTIMELAQRNKISSFGYTQHLFIESIQHSFFSPFHRMTRRKWYKCNIFYLCPHHHSFCVDRGPKIPEVYWHLAFMHKYIVVLYLIYEVIQNSFVIWEWWNNMNIIKYSCKSSCHSLSDIIYPDVLFWPVLEQCWNMATVMNSDEQPPATQEKQIEELKLAEALDHTFNILKKESQCTSPNCLIVFLLSWSYIRLYSNEEKKSVK